MFGVLMVVSGKDGVLGQDNLCSIDAANIYAMNLQENGLSGTKSMFSLSRDYEKLY
jgi:hypothetical protein